MAFYSIPSSLTPVTVFVSVIPVFFSLLKSSVKSPFAIIATIQFGNNKLFVSSIANRQCIKWNERRKKENDFKDHHLHRLTVIFNVAIAYSLRTFVDTLKLCVPVRSPLITFFCSRNCQHHSNPINLGIEKIFQCISDTFSAMLICFPLNGEFISYLLQFFFATELISSHRVYRVYFDITSGLRAIGVWGYFMSLPVFVGWFKMINNNYLPMQCRIQITWFP